MAESDVPHTTAIHAGPPFGMTGQEPVFARTRALARALFGKVAVSLVITRDGAVWRSNDPSGRSPPTAPVGARVQATGRSLWMEDARLDPETANFPLVTEPPFIRFCAASPVTLSDGEVIGVLVLAGPEVRPFDAELAANLDLLAGGIADECDRARAVELLSRRDAALRESRSALAALVETAPASIMMTDRQMRPLQVSRRWREDLALDEVELDGRTVYELAPTVFDQYREAFDRCLAGETIRSDRVRITAPNGFDGWMRTELTPWRHASGEIGGLVSAAVDISDLVTALEETERSEQRLQMAAQIAELHIWELDYWRGTLVQAGAAENMFGRPLTFEDLAADTNVTIHPDDRERIGAAWSQAVLNDEPYFPEYRVARDDDLEVWAACTVKLVKDEDGTPLRLLGAMQNITARKQAEAALVHAKDEAEAANRAKSTFLATMSHEIRTPLNGVLGMAQVMALGDLSDVQRGRLDIIRESGETLLAILNDVLDLAKIEAGKLEIEEVEFDLEELALGAYAAFTAIANKKGLNFDLVVQPEARGRYRGDSTRVRQIIYNLVSNALKFTQTGDVHVLIGLDRSGLRIEVSDTGVGIRPDRLAVLFQSFEQADASTTRRFGGTGLGLAICRELSELMGGAISAHSVEGEGSTFSVSLPLPRLGAPGPRVQMIEASQGDALPSLRVLAAEDNAINQLVLRTLLEQAGVEPTVVSDGAEAVQAWRDGPWDVILMDVQMPVMDGPTATRAIRDEEARTGRRRTPIIALTANAMAHQVSEYFAAGMDDFVAKPIEASVLFAALERSLDRAQAA